MNHNLITYSSHLKLADMISTDYELLTILERLDIRLGFGDDDIETICKKHNISVDLFLMICNIYSFENYIPNMDFLTINDIPHIVSYLRSSHNYYSNQIFPKLHGYIHNMLEDCDKTNSEVINRFYDNYDSEVNNHFNYEETTVFPYIESLINKNEYRDQNYSIEHFEKNNSNIEETLDDLKNIIIKYLPEEISNLYRYKVLKNIFIIERDLKKHSLVENKILIPLVSKFEKDGK